MTAQGKRFFRIFRWIAGCILVFFLLLALLFALLQTRTVKRQLPAWVAAKVSTAPDFQLKVGALRGLIPFDIRLDSLMISDSSGEWFRLELLIFRWSPLAFIQGRIHIRELSAASVQIDRLPLSRKKKEARKKGWPPWPPNIPAFFIECFNIGQFTLGKSLIGQKATFTVNGKMNTLDHSEGLTGAFRLERIDISKVFAEITFTIKGKEPVVTVHTMIDDQDALIANAMNLKVIGPVFMELQGDGPIDSWAGKLNADVTGFGSIESKIELSVKEKLNVKLEGHLKSLVPTVVGDKLLFDMDIRYEKKGDLIVQEADFKAQKNKLKIKGKLDLKKEIIDADFNLQTEDISYFKEYVRAEVSGELTCQGKLSGPVRKPLAVLSFKLEDASLSDDIHASNLTLDLQMESLGPLVSTFPGLLLKGNGSVEGLSIQNAKSIPIREFQWKFGGEISPGFLIQISKLDIAGKDIFLRLSGQLDSKELVFEGDTVVEVKDLKRFSGLLGPEVGGEALLQAHLMGDGPNRSVSASIKGHVTNLAPLPNGMKDIVSTGIEYKGKLNLKDTSVLNISDFLIKTEFTRLTADASIDLSKRDLAGQCHLVIPELAVFSRMIKQPLEGALNLDLSVKGPFINPKTLAKAETISLSMQGIEIKRGVLSLDLEGWPPGLKGHAQVTLQHTHGLIQANSDLSLDKEHFTLSDLSIDAPGAKAEGNIEFDLNKHFAQGELQGKFQDISQISLIWNEKVKGIVSFKTEFSGDLAGQSIILDLDGKDIETRFGNLEEAVLHAQIKDVFQALKGQIGLNVKTFRKEGLTANTVSLTAEGNAKQADFFLSAEGAYREAFEIRTQGSFISSSHSKQLQLDSLQGFYANYPIGITKPLRIIYTKQDFTLEPVDFNLGKSSFHASSRFGTEALSVDAQFHSIPLEMLRLIGFPDIAGTAKGNIRLTGRPDQPRGVMELSVMDIRSKRAGALKIAPAYITANTEFLENRIQFSISVHGLSKKPIVATFAVPVNFSILPFIFSIPPQGELQAQIQAEANLSSIPEFFLLEEQSIEGMVNVTLSIAGTVKSPKITGNLQISDGAYENTRIGIIIKDIQILIAGEGQKFILEKAEATDGQEGSISAQGFIHLFSTKDFDTKLDLVINEATLIRRIDFNAKTDGHLTLSGSSKALVLNGRLRVGPAEFYIPERLPPEVIDLEIIEINQVGEEKEPVKKSKPILSNEINLDLIIELPGRVFVRGRGLDSEWGGTLLITGNVNNPTITGNLSTIRGNFKIFGKQFVLTSGSIVFDGSVPPMSGIDVIAENRRSDLTSRIHFSGNPSALSLNLESDPTLPQDEILARVLFGRSVSETTPIQALRLAQALNALRGKGGVLDFMGRTRKFVGLDQLDIKQSEEGNGEAAVSIGKYLADGVFIEMEKGMGANSGKVSAEIELTPNVTLESETGSDSKGGVGLNWKWDY
jgi:translocation and assembly module TamB